MLDAETREARRLLRMGLRQYKMSQADYIEHDCLKLISSDGPALKRAFRCPCKYVIAVKGRSNSDLKRERARKVMENALRDGMPLSRVHASRLLCLVSQSKKARVWRKARRDRTGVVGFRDPFLAGLMRTNFQYAYLNKPEPFIPTPRALIASGDYTMIVDEIIHAITSKQTRLETRATYRTKLLALMSRRGGDWQQSFIGWVRRTEAVYVFDAWDETIKGPDFMSLSSSLKIIKQRSKSGRFNITFARPEIKQTKTATLSVVQRRERNAKPDPRRTREASHAEALRALCQQAPEFADGSKPI